MSETRDRDEENVNNAGNARQDSAARAEGDQRPRREGERSTSGYGARPGGRPPSGRGRFGRDRDRDSGGRRGGGGGRFRRQRRKVCAFCVDKVKHIDYKDHQRLRDFVSDRGKILKSRMTGTCFKHQRKLSAAIKRARQVALLPFVAE
jgi:small subunit ribosomal protein S18